MENWQDEIIKAQTSQKIGFEMSMENSDISIFLKSLKENLISYSDKDSFEKSWSSDLQSKFPSGSWKTINGARVFVNNGKVVAGLDGFNDQIDKFFEGKGKKESGKGEDKKKFTDEKRNIWIPNMTKGKLDKLMNKENLSENDKEDLKDFKYFLLTDKESATDKGFYQKLKVSQKGEAYALKDKFLLTNIENKLTQPTKTEPEGKKEMSGGMKDKVDYFKELETKDEKEKYINTLKNKWIPETEEDLKKAKDEKVKKIYSDLLEGLKNELLPAVEKEMKNFNASQPKPVTLDTFKDVAKQSKDASDFIKRSGEIKNVPPEVAQEFFNKYGKGKSQEEAARAFMKEYGSKGEVDINLKKQVEEKKSGKRKEVDLPF